LTISFLTSSSLPATPQAFESFSKFSANDTNIPSLRVYGYNSENQIIKDIRNGEQVIIFKWLNRIQKQDRCEFDGTKV
jgi:hypothetical protein